MLVHADGSSIIKDVRKNTLKIDLLLSAFVRIGPHPPAEVRSVTKYVVNSDSWTSSNYQMSVSDCCWHWQDTVLAAGCQRVLSIYLLATSRTPQSTCCEQRFIQLVTLSLLMSLSTVHCYTLPTSALTKIPVHPCPLLSILGHTPPPPCLFVCLLGV